MEAVTGISVTAMLYPELLWQEFPESNLRDFLADLKISGSQFVYLGFR